MLAEIAPLQHSPAGFTPQEVFETVTEPEPAATEFGQPEVSAFEPAAAAPAFDASYDQVEEVAVASVVAARLLPKRSSRLTTILSPNR